MNSIRYLFCLFLICCACESFAQITVYRDSSQFDNAFGKLRDIDFEDVYSLSLRDVRFRNPFGLHSMASELPDENGKYPDSVDVFLWLGQGATLDFPTRTRTVMLEGYANSFELRVTDFNDSVSILPLAEFPRTISLPSGIKRIQFLGTDGHGNDDVNWSGGLLGVTTIDESGDTLASTEFDELRPDEYYLIGQPHKSYEYAEDDTAMYGPVEHHGVIFTEPELGFTGTHLTRAHARVDADNPIGNLALEMAPGARMDFPAGTEGVLLSVELVHERDSLVFEISDYAGRIDTVLETGWGREYDTNWVEDQRATYLHIGFSSPDGIKQVRLLAGWAAEIRDKRDLGEGIDTAYFGRTMMLTALHLAENIPAEISGIMAGVGDLERRKFLSESNTDRLRSELSEAITNVQGRKYEEAVARLNGFRNSVNALYSEKSLAPEEAKSFTESADYVISRLALSTAEENEESGTPALRWISDGESVRILFEAREAAFVNIHDLNGNLVNSFEAAGGEIRWDLYDQRGRSVSAGLYIISLKSAGSMRTVLVPVVK